jgi:hypothetical protein
MQNSDVDITNHVNEIHDINRNIQQFARRAMDLRAQMGIETSSVDVLKSNFTLKNFKEIIFSDICFLFSAVFLFTFFIPIYFLFMNIPEEKFTISYLESDEMNPIFVLLFICIFIILWNVYVFISIIICRINLIEFSSNTQKPNEITTADLIYFNPVIFCYIVYFFNPNYFRTGFDVFCWALFATMYFLNFMFTVKIFSYSNLKINSITNTLLPENNTLILKIRLNYFFLFLINVLSTILIKNLIDETNFMFKYFLIFKVIMIFIF